MRHRRSILPAARLGAVRCAAAGAIVVTILGGAAVGARAASIEAAHGAVAAEHRLASAAGVEMLERGGNAVDAAVAAALATGVVNPSSSGIGGGGFLVLWDARRSRARTIDFRETAPRGATETMFVRADGTVDSEASKTGPLAAGVPGELRGFELALERYGRLKLADVAAPAIRIARDGFAIEAHLASMIAAGRARIAADAGLASVFLHEDGSPKREGEILRRPDLAATLERVVKVGVKVFYEGEIAADIVRTVSLWHGRGIPTPAVPDNARTASQPGSPAASADNGRAAGPDSLRPAAPDIRQAASPLDATDLRNYRAIERAPL